MDRENTITLSRAEGPAAPGALPATSLVICSRNRARMLRETVESVLQGDELPTELIVVDQSDAPNESLASMQPARGCEMRYRWTRSRGLSRARNEGIAAARHDIIAIIDDDMYVQAGWYGALIRALVTHGPHIVITGRVLPAEEAAGGFVPALVLSETPALYAGRIGTDVLAGGHMAAYRAALLELGGFDERLGAGGPYPAADDNDLGFRLLEAGYRIRYEPAAVVYHRAWRSNRDYLKMRWNYGRGKGGYYAKHLGPGLGLRDRYMLWRMARDIGRRALQFPYKLRHERRKAWGDIVYSLGVLTAAAQWLFANTGRPQQ
jgi:GT2 family glycosyltransferase